MIEQPCVELRIGPAAAVGTSGPGSQRALEFARRWATFHRREVPACHIELLSEIPPHSGLGSGTQLALAVAAGLNALWGLPSLSPHELALSAGRGLRSAVGTYGFAFGGLIVEQGKLAEEPVSPLDCRIEIPGDWRFVLVLPVGLSGLAGPDEAAAFSSLPPVPPDLTGQLIAEAHERMVPAVVTGDFDRFAASLYRYGRMSGECFAPRQGGPYNGPLLTALVERVRQLGCAGVGQSSWGPAIFAATPSQPAAQDLATRLAAHNDFGVNLEITISRPCNQGARVEIRVDAPAELSISD
jgi:beta-RFAP synthase